MSDTAGALEWVLEQAIDLACQNSPGQPAGTFDDLMLLCDLYVEQGGSGNKALSWKADCKKHKGTENFGCPPPKATNEPIMPVRTSLAGLLRWNVPQAQNHTRPVKSL